MAGKKGKSGGARKGAGGARPGAGRKPKKATPESANHTGGVEVSLEAQPHGGALKRSTSAPVPIPETDMLKMLQDVALGKTDASALQVRAAIAAVQYTHTKAGEGGKKEARKEAAGKVAANRFAPSSPPRLVAVK
jgi:hypothetical protein